MTDPITFVRDADPVADIALDPATRERMDAEIDRLLAIEPPPSAAPRAGGGRSRRRAAIAGVAATIAVAAALAALPSGPGRGPVTPAPANAAEVLTRLGARAAEAAALEARYVYVHRRSYSTHMRPRSGGEGMFATVVPSDIETWFSRDGSERVERTRDLWDEATYPTEQDRIDAEASSPQGLPEGPMFLPEEQTVRFTDTKVAGFTVAELQALPTAAGALRARLEAADLGFDSPSPLVTATGLVLGSPLTPPAVRAAAFAVLSDLPGATLVPGATDPLGRGGSAVEFDTDSWRTLYIFDPKTSELIATRSIGKKELPGRTISDWSLQLSSGAADHAPSARDGEQRAGGGGGG